MQELLVVLVLHSCSEAEILLLVLWTNSGTQTQFKMASKIVYYSGI